MEIERTHSFLTKTNLKNILRSKQPMKMKIIKKLYLQVFVNEATRNKTYVVGIQNRSKNYLFEAIIEIRLQLVNLISHSVGIRRATMVCIRVIMRFQKWFNFQPENEQVKNDAANINIKLQ
jgi:hypothetical protein